MAGKYTRLEQYLRGLPERRRTLTLGFKQIEDILNNSLPASAYESLKWWEHATEGNHINTRAWTNAGWKIEKVDLNRQQVKLVRVG